ncbi:MAG: hypothetical protein RLY16_460 [Bacteroidota bacterium]
MLQTVFYLTLVLFSGYAALILYYALAWADIPEIGYAVSKGVGELPLVTIIIPARNEAKNIGACLQSILAQTYPASHLEILVVDDHSTDETASIIDGFSTVRRVNLADYPLEPGKQAYKKKAIDVAISLSKGALIVTTDADCIASPGWIATLVSAQIQTGASLLVMPVQYHPIVTAMDIFQALDFMTLQGITGASVHRGMHSMCNGANLAYTRKAFEAVGGFSGIDHIASGDDMLLMHKIYCWQPSGIVYLKLKEVIVQTPPAAGLRAFLQQRIRWASKADQYEDKRIFAVLLWVYLVNVWLLVLGIWSCWNIDVFKIFVSCLLGKIIVELAYLLPVAQFFGAGFWVLFFPLAQPFHIVYTVVAGWLGKFGKYEWKGRTVK